eukprot:gene10798-12774_t
MFVTSTISDSHVRILPENLGKARVEAVTDQLEITYVDKVFPELGFIISIYEILSIEGGTIYPSDGGATFSVVFRPYVGEVLIGRLEKSNSAGLKVTLDFFNDVFVPEHALQAPSEFDEQEQLWVWKIDGNEAYMELEEKVRFRVMAVRFPEEPNSLAQENDTHTDKPEGEEAPLPLGCAGNPFAPMIVE